MKILSDKLTALTLTLCVVFAACGSYACAQSKTNFSKADFENLRWLEGTWRGVDASGQNQFFER